MLAVGSVAPLQCIFGRRLFADPKILGLSRRLFASKTKRHAETLTLVRLYSGSNSKDKKILSPTNPTIAPQTKTTVNTGTETKIFTRQDSKSSAADEKTTTTGEQKTATANNAVNGNSGEGKQISKTIEIETSKGLLSVTTTIEDSKINDIILEKSKNSPPKKSEKTNAQTQAEEIERSAAAKSKENVEKLLVKPEDIAKEKNKAKKAAKLKEAKSEVMGAAAAAADVAKTTVASAAAAVKELLTKKDVNATAGAVPVAAVEMKPKARIKVDFNRSSLERNFITPARAMSDFLLTPGDLENLPKIKRRSPYEREPPMTVYWRKDVEAKAIEVWGSRESLLKEKLKRELERKQHQQNIFTVKRRLRDYRREIGYRTTIYDKEPGLRGKSGQVVLIAIGINSMNFLFKVCAWLYTGSHSMFAEAIHSLADTINQLILAYGIHKSTQIADSAHPYGYSNMRYVSSLISGVGIFCVGTGLSVYHGITGLMHPEPIADFFWAFFILGGSLVSEGATLLVAINEIRRSAKLQGVSFKDYVISGKDPCVNVVLTEDAAAVASVGVAAACMGLSQFSGSPVFDAMGSLFVGGILGAVASFIIYTNVQALVGKSIPEERLNKINSELESDVMIRAIHDVKGIDMGNSLVRYKAEMDFDGRELTRSYLDKQDLNELLRVVKSFQTVDELEQFLLTHGENIVDLMGGEIDRIEMKLRKKFPEIRHCDLEIL